MPTTGKKKMGARKNVFYQTLLLQRVSCINTRQRPEVAVLKSKGFLLKKEQKNTENKLIINTGQTLHVNVIYENHNSEK